MAGLRRKVNIKSVIKAGKRIERELVGIKS